MLKNLKTSHIPIFLWGFVILFIISAVFFPRWISVFYPQPHRDTVMQMSREYQVDPNLVFAIIQAESKFEDTARSHAGARGLMQIMPETAYWIAEQIALDDFDADMLDNPAVNIRLGCWYLASLHAEFGGRLPLVVAAYNAGRGKVNKWIEEEKWDGTYEHIEQVPYQETRQYIKKVISNYESYQAIYSAR